MRALVALVTVLITLVVVDGVAGGRVTPKPAPPVPAAGRIAVIVLENRSWSQIVGNPHAPYLNSLLHRGALATHYYAIAHPSLPNYLALTTGGHSHVNGDCTLCRSSGRSLANQLETAGISWRAYFEGIGNPLSTQRYAGSPYNPHYNPFAYTEALRAPDPVADVSNFSTLSRDLAKHALPRFAWIAPDIWHDGHNVKLARVDQFARRFVPRVLAALGPRGVLFLTWDEGRTSDTSGAHGRGGGHVPLVALGPLARPGARLSTPANHYSLLRTIEDSLGLRRLGHARDHRTPSLAGLLHT